VLLQQPARQLHVLVAVEQGQGLLQEAHIFNLQGRLYGEPDGQGEAAAYEARLTAAAAAASGGCAMVCNAHLQDPKAIAKWLLGTDMCSSCNAGTHVSSDG
jgi:hypothetical protein